MKNKNHSPANLWLRGLILILLISLAGIPTVTGFGQEQVETDSSQEYYLPAGFSWKGGSGRMKIACTMVTLSGQSAWADLTFSSGKIVYVRIGETQYDPYYQDEKHSAYHIPVTLSQENVIYGCTTAMSAPHEVEYTIYVEAGEPVDEEEIPLYYRFEDEKEADGEADKAKDGQEEAASAENDREEAAADDNKDQEDADTVSQGKEAPKIGNLVLEKQMDFTFADKVDIYYYEGGYKLIDVYDSARYFVLPQEADLPEGIEEDMTVIRSPKNIYLAATSAMALFDAMDSLDVITLSSIRSDGWYVEAAKEAMEEGRIVFAGKYSEPDFELMLAKNCDLAIESTMILHSPKTKEMLEDLGIPVFIDRSSYEEHPLGRTEWVKVYGALLGREEAAEAFFETQAAIMKELEGFENTGKTVAFFAVNTSNSVVVRKASDYIPQMIELAGAHYVLADLPILNDEETRRTSIDITMEEFYANALNADYLIYNATIQNPIRSIEELLAKSELFADFKAVKEGNVWLADKYLYQATDIVGQLIRDIHLMVTDGDESEIVFLSKIE